MKETAIDRFCWRLIYVLAIGLGIYCGYAIHDSLTTQGKQQKEIHEASNWLK